MDSPIILMLAADELPTTTSNMDRLSRWTHERMLRRYTRGKINRRAAVYLSATLRSVIRATITRAYCAAEFDVRFAGLYKFLTKSHVRFLIKPLGFFRHAGILSRKGQGTFPKPVQERPGTPNVWYRLRCEMEKSRRRLFPERYQKIQFVRAPQPAPGTDWRRSGLKELEKTFAKKEGVKPGNRYSRPILGKKLE